MGDPFARLGAAVVRGRWVVLAIWLVVLALAVVFAVPKAAKGVKAGGLNVPGSDSDRVSQILGDEFNASTARNVTVVFHSADQTIDAPIFKAEATGALARLATVPNVHSVASFFSTDNPMLVSKDRRTTVATVTLDGTEGERQATILDLRKQLSGLSIEHYVTGLPAVERYAQVGAEEDLRRAETFAFPLILILLLLVFRTLIAALIPVILGACSVILALSVIAAISAFVNTSVYSLNTASMIGLGLGLDFALIVITRFREERGTGQETGSAVVRTMATAGRSIFYSGATVILAMLVLTALQIHLVVVRSISLAVMLVACTALLAGLTLLPALLAILGDRIERLRVIPSRPARDDRTAFWYRFSHAVMRRSWLWLIASLAILVLLAIPTKDIHVYSTSPDVLPSSVESVAGAKAIDNAFGPNRITPIQIVLQTERNGIWKPEFLAALGQLTDTLAADPRNAEVVSLTSIAHDVGVAPTAFRIVTPAAARSVAPVIRFVPGFVNLTGGNDTTVITVISKSEVFQADHQAFIGDLRSRIIPGTSALQSYRVLVGGDGAVLTDFRHAIYGRFPLIALAVMALIYLILMMFFQSVFLPLKAVLLNLVSVLATYGALVLIFQHQSVTRLLGFNSVGAINLVVPPVLFAVLFALSTDYEVFLLSRVKEYYHQLGDNTEAVATGLQKTARVITAAGLILIATFGSFSSAHNVTIKELGVGLAIGILLDSTIVRIIMVPATMQLAGKANWWMPRWLKKIVPQLREAPPGEPDLVPRGSWTG